MDRARKGMRTGFSWLRRLVALGLIGISVFALYNRYCEQGELPWECASRLISGDSPETSTTSTTVDATGTTAASAGTAETDVGGFVPEEMITVEVTPGTQDAPGYPRENLVDGDPSTAWSCSPCLNAESPGLNEVITLRLDREVTVDSLEFYNGFPDGAGFVENFRAQRILVGLGEESLEVILSDVPAAQKLEIEGTADQLRITVLSVGSSGSADAAFGFSEVRVHGAYSSTP